MRQVKCIPICYLLSYCFCMVLVTMTRHLLKLMRPSARPDDPTKGGKKRVPPDRPEAIKKRKKLDGSEDVNKKKKLVDSEDIKKKKIVNESKLSAVEKKIPQRSTESQRGDMKEITEKNVPPTLTKAVKRTLAGGWSSQRECLIQTMLSHEVSNWCGFFHLKVDAQAALKFAIGSSNLFGNANVRSYIRDVGAETMESEPVRVQKEDSAMPHSPRNPHLSTGHLQKTAVQPSQPSAVQLKSCLKKPSADRSVYGNGRCVTRVKFILGGEGSTKNLNNNFLVFLRWYIFYHIHIQWILLVVRICPKFVPQSPLPGFIISSKLSINMPSC
ncbi:hypothetical protein Salat_1657700 [Sesamum alatum]|uniref:Uncharacterized protein n=1 Tax=Sesamum alatum TaxID=300844 RepID=A0AAE2CJN8_9LAMI|nr:hypothetical protein Salat_1657700 [Sesamum alatum]